MKRILKSSLSVFLAIAIIFGSACVGLGKVGFGDFFVVNAHAASVNDLTFTLSDDGTYYIVTACDKSASGDIVIPDTYRDLPVKVIGEMAFLQCAYLESVEFSDNITNIDFGAFAYCASLKSVTIPDGVKALGYTFWGCEKLAEVILPDSVEILDSTFGNCGSLRNIVIPDSVVSMVSAFSECSSLIEVNIPEGVEDISKAFMNCENLTSIVIPGSVRDMTDAFIDCTSLKSVVISAGVTEMNSYAFDKCINLTEVTIPRSVTKIEDYVFRFFNKPLNIFYEGSLTDWKSIEIGDNNNLYDSVAIHYNSTGHKFSDKWTIDVAPTYSEKGSKSRHCLYCDAKIDVTEIPCILINDIMYVETDGLLCDGEITYVLKLKAGEVVSGSVFAVEFDADALAIVEEKSGACTSVDEYGNERNNYGGFYIGGMKYGADDTYVIAHMDFGDSVFNQDTGYIKFTFKIKDYSKQQAAVDIYCNEFVGDSETTAKECNVLVAHFELPIVPSTGHKYTLVYDYENKTKTEICTVCGDKNIEPLVISDVLTFNLNAEGTAYTVSDCVSEYVGDIKIPSKHNGLPITAIGTDAFRDCTKITSIVIPDSVTSIGGSAFRNCTSLKSIDLSDNITAIPGAMCFGCSSLETVIIPDGVTNVGGYAFSGCKALKIAVIPDSVTNIGGSVFANCTSLIIICNENSVVKSYADTNSVAYILNTDETFFNVSSKRIYTDVLGGNLNNIISSSDSLSYTMNTASAGTGAIVDINKDGALHTQLTLVVKCDTNGDSVCDVLDCFDVERESNRNGALSGVYAEAGDINNDGIIDINDYQSVVNKAIA